MKSTNKIFFTLFISTFSLLLISNIVSSQQTAGEFFEKALYIEEGQGDLQKAINFYQKILKQFPKDREIAAKAQLHIGLCYEKLGLKEAQKAYQKVVDNYPEQTEAVKIAKEKLSILLKARAVVDKADKEFRIRQIWTYDGIDESYLEKPSPDGRYLSYNDTNTMNLAILDLSTKKKRFLTKNFLTNKGPAFKFDDILPNSTLEAALGSIWSPDSNQLAYSWVTLKNISSIKDALNLKDATWELRIIGLDGSEPRVLYRNEEVEELNPVDWSPDGKYILAGFFRKDKTSQAVLISVADGSVLVQKTVDKRYRGGGLISPDGRYIVYDFQTSKDSSGRDIFLLSTDLSSEIPLVEHPADDYVLGWAPDGKRLLFASDRTGDWDAWIIQVVDGKPKGDPELIKKDIGQIKPLGFTKKGSFYYALRTRMTDVFIATLDLEKGKLLTPPKLATQRFTGSNVGPGWSPDGKYFSYLSKRVPGSDGFGSRALIIRFMETGKEREFIPKLIFFWGPRWAPDGRSILGVGSEKKDRVGLYKIDVKTGDIKCIVQYDSGEGIGFPAWSPDGKKIFYTCKQRRQKIARILMYDLVTKQEKEIYREDFSTLMVVPNPFYPRYMVISPDGKFLAFTVQKSKKFGYYLEIIPTAGGKSREVLQLEEGETVTSIAWTPDSRGLIFAANRTNKPKSELWRVSVEGGRRQKLGLKMDRMYRLCIHPEGQRIAFYSDHISKKVWVMENFLPELKDKK